MMSCALCPLAPHATHISGSQECLLPFHASAFSSLRVLDRNQALALEITFHGQPLGLYAFLKRNSYFLRLLLSGLLVCSKLTLLLCQLLGPLLLNLSGSFCSLPRGLCLSSLFFYDLGQTLPLSLDFCLSRRASLGLEAKALLLDLSRTLPFGIGRGFSGLQRGLYLTSLIFNLG